MEGRIHSNNKVSRILFQHMTCVPQLAGHFSEDSSPNISGSVSDIYVSKALHLVLGELFFLCLHVLSSLWKQ